MGLAVELVDLYCLAEVAGLAIPPRLAEEVALAVPPPGWQRRLHWLISSVVWRRLDWLAPNTLWRSLD
jgi:hypothetical protein